jgi:hypothetical protein
LITVSPQASLLPNRVPENLQIAVSRLNDGFCESVSGHQSTNWPELFLTKTLDEKKPLSRRKTFCPEPFILQMIASSAKDS